MKKKLLVAALGAIAAGTVSAQTANVTLFGVVDTYLANIRANNGGKSVTQMDAGGISGSRWGLRGSEDLGGGMSAAFTLENGFLSDSGALGQGGRLFGRQAHVSLNGGFGSVTLGRQYTPAFYAAYNGDVDEYSNFSIVSNHLVLAGAGMLRADNAVIYLTPNMGGFAMSAQWAFGEVAGTVATARWESPASIAASSLKLPSLSSLNKCSANRLRPVANRTASASSSRSGVSVSFAVSHATARPLDRCSSRHCASRDVLPKPAGALSSTMGAAASSVLSLARRGRASRSRGTRGAMTRSARSGYIAVALSSGVVAMRICSLSRLVCPKIVARMGPGRGSLKSRNAGCCNRLTHSHLAVHRAGLHSHFVASLIPAICRYPEPANVSSRSAIPGWPPSRQPRYARCTYTCCGTSLPCRVPERSPRG